MLIHRNGWHIYYKVHCDNLFVKRDKKTGNITEINLNELIEAEQQDWHSETLIYLLIRSAN